MLLLRNQYDFQIKYTYNQSSLQHFESDNLHPSHVFLIHPKTFVLEVLFYQY